MEARVLRTFGEPLTADDGRAWVAKICGRERPDGRWESWIEFVPPGGSPVLRSRRESTQSSIADLQWWAEGLSAVYLEGALERTLADEEPDPPPPAGPIHESPRFDGPIPDPGAARGLAADELVLNPLLEVHRGEEHLRTRLRALSAADLRTLAWAYDIDAALGIDVGTLAGDELVELIVTWSRDRTAH